MKASRLFLLTTIGASIALALACGPPDRIEKDDTAEEEVPALTVSHSPNPAIVEEGGVNGYNYTCAYATTVAAGVGEVTIQSFGAFKEIDGEWVNTNYSDEMFSDEDFADWYGCEGAKVQPEAPCTDPNNWTAGKDMFSSTTKWVFYGLDSEGNSVSAEAIMECVSPDD